MLSKKMEALSGKTDSLSTKTTALENDAGVEYVIEFEDISDKTETVDKWLDVNGEGIYGSRTWREAQEGPTKVKEGQFTDAEDKVFTPEDFRFTRKGSFIYAYCLHFPEDGKVCIKALADVDASHLPKFHGIIKNIDILGFGGTVEWSRDEEGLHVFAPDMHSEFPVGIRIRID